MKYMAEISSFGSHEITVGPVEGTHPSQALRDAVMQYGYRGNNISVQVLNENGKVHTYHLRGGGDRESYERVRSEKATVSRREAKDVFNGFKGVSEVING